MENRFRHRLVLASLLFGMFFGAGNLIFPIFLGQHSASNVNSSILGFVISGVGLAMMAVIFTVQTKKTNLEDSLEPYGKLYARLFTILLILTIGPLFALPRTATVPYEVSIRLIFPSYDQKMVLLIYSVIFFVLAAILALKPNNIKDLIGKIINPLFLALLLIFFVVFLLKPMGSINTVEPLGAYVNRAAMQGFEDGYQTMDVLAAMMFGFVLIEANDKNGNDKEKIGDLIQAAIIAGVLMAIIYYLLAYMGSSSVNILSASPNGGLALGEIFSYYFGYFGLILFGIIITLACLKTAIGLIVATSDYFSNVFPFLKYEVLVVIVSLVSIVVSNFGLEAIIKYAIPVLNFIYPLAIIHVFTGLFLKNWDKRVIVLRTSLFFSLIASVLEVLKGIYEHKLLDIYLEKLPLSNIGLSWISFAVFGLVLGLIIEKTLNKKV